jgi:hypothetical protein
MRKLHSLLASLIDLRDAFAFGGLAMIGYGLFSIYPPAAWIVVGGILLWIGVR